MQTLALHLFDVLENSAKAGASHVSLGLHAHDTGLHIHLEDDGPGFPPHILDNPADPYATTRRERPVGLGLALLRQSAEETGGSFHACNSPRGGACVQLCVIMSHWDARPLGDPTGLVLETAAAWPDLVLRVSAQVEDADAKTVFDGAEVAAALDGVPLTHPSVRRALQADLQESFAPLIAWVERTRDGLFTRAS